MADSINVLISTFPGLNLPATLCLSLPQDSTCQDLRSHLSERLPENLLSQNRFIVLTNSHREVNLQSQKPLSTFIPNNHDRFLPLRLSLPLCGGKGGFGSQLRAAGGRMSSRKKRAGEGGADPQGSNRNLDGRRLRTVTEAKALAEYLAVKPEMDKKEKEERYKRWEAVVAAAERKEEELREGKRNARVDGKWLEGKEEAESKTREAVLQALRAGRVEGVAINLEGDSEEGSEEGDEPEEEEGEEGGSTSSGSKEAARPAAKPAKFFGWDDEDEMSDEEEDQEEEEIPFEAADTGKGKGKAKA